MGQGGGRFGRDGGLMQMLYLRTIFDDPHALH
jgi:hypothetical protein